MSYVQTVHDPEARGQMCSDDAHVKGCPCESGGDPEYVVLPLNAMRCVVCGHRLDDMGWCDGCMADKEAALWGDDDDR